MRRASYSSLTSIATISCSLPMTSFLPKTTRPTPCRWTRSWSWAPYGVTSHSGDTWLVSPPSHQSPISAGTKIPEHCSQRASPVWPPGSGLFFLPISTHHLIPVKQALADTAPPSVPAANSPRTNIGSCRPRWNWPVLSKPPCTFSKAVVSSCDQPDLTVIQVRGCRVVAVAVV